MSLPHQAAVFKNSHHRLLPAKAEGRHIRASIFLHGFTQREIAVALGISPVNVHRVIYGKTRSRRTEAEIVRILGKVDWNEVVLEARSEVQKKPVDVVVREIEQNLKAEASAAEEDFKNSEQALIYGHDWSAALKAQKEERERSRQKNERKKKGVSA